MTNKEAVNWLINLTADIGKSEHRDLWHYEQALYEIKKMLDEDTNVPSKKGVFILDITVEMLRNASLEGVEDLMVSGEMEDISLLFAQPEKRTQERTETHACDLIRRQEAIGTVRHAWAKGLEPTQFLEELPSAQPEIITCIECKYYNTDTEQCNNDKGLRFIDFGNPERMWCSWAERREK